MYLRKLAFLSPQCVKELDVWAEEMANVVVSEISYGHISLSHWISLLLL